MYIDKIGSPNDVVACVDIYQPMNDESFLRSDRTRCLSNFLGMAANANFFIRVAYEDNGEVLGFIIAEEGECGHIPGRCLQQRYYASKCKGKKSYKVVEMLHQALIERAIQRKMDYILSQGSFLDEQNVFARMLERMGWERRHYLAVYKLK